MAMIRLHKATYDQCKVVGIFTYQFISYMCVFVYINTYVYT